MKRLIFSFLAVFLHLGGQIINVLVIVGVKVIHTDIVKSFVAMILKIFMTGVLELITNVCMIA